MEGRSVERSADLRVRIMLMSGLGRGNPRPEEVRAPHDKSATEWRASSKDSLSFHIPLPFMLLSPLGERLGEGVMQEGTFELNPLT